MREIAGWDRDWLLWFNSFHTPWLDPIMLLLTKTLFWLPLYIFLIYVIFKQFKTEGWFVLGGVAIAVLLADRITSGLMKPYFARLRPSNEPALQSLLHVVNNYRGGQYGFASSHAANTFAVALLLWLVLRRFYPWSALMFLWALLMCFTRLYLGVHYPGDILAGILMGLCCGIIGYLAYLWSWAFWQKKNKLS